MAAMVKVTCRECGEVMLSPERVSVHVPSMRYFFVCTTCGDDVEKHATEEQLDLLLSIEVQRYEGASAPWDFHPPHPEAPDLTAPPLTMADVYRYRLRLDRWDGCIHG